MDKSKYFSAFALGAMVVIGLGLHLWRIGYPARPVFDEAHFATYAADYASGRAFDDVHPPLGKLIYAAVLSFFPAETVSRAQFSEIVRAPDGTLNARATDIPYGDFPYVALRMVSALFGALLPVTLYFFMMNIGAGRIAALLAAAFVMLDNAFLVDTRLILLDGMFIAFGIAALALYFHKRCFAVAAGAIWGLSLAVKLTGIVFVGPVLAAYLLARRGAMRGDANKTQTQIQTQKELERLSKFVVAGLIVLFLVVLAGTFYFPTGKRLGTLSFLGFFDRGASAPSPAWQAGHPVRAYFLASVGETMFSLANYVVGRPHPDQSPWYFWPVLQVPMLYYYAHAGVPSGASGGHGADGGGNILFAGNPVVWLASTLAVILAIVFARRYLRERLSGKLDRAPFFILLAGYVSSMLPFILFVRRSTFLYHYLPALPFAFGLLAWFIAEGLKAREWRDMNARRTFLLAMILIAAALGFLALAPGTYGL